MSTMPSYNSIPENIAPYIQADPNPAEGTAPPCPFCGGMSFVYSRLDPQSTKWKYVFSVYCHDRHCQLHTADFYDSEAEAVEAWKNEKEETFYFPTWSGRKYVTIID